MSTKIKTQHVTITGKGQNVDFNELLVMDGFKLRAEIHVDSYKNQGRAAIFVWSQATLSWNKVFAIDPLMMATNENLGYKPAAPTVADFQADRTLLLTQAAFILGQ